MLSEFLMTHSHYQEGQQNKNADIVAKSQNETRMGNSRKLSQLGFCLVEVSTRQFARIDFILREIFISARM